MTRSELEIMAAEFKKIKPIYHGENDYLFRIKMWTACVEAVAKSCLQTNPRFKEKKFFEACGII